jgi:hypothetical protein
VRRASIQPTSSRAFRRPWQPSPDLDFGFESDLETIQQSAADEVLKRQAMARLHEHHRERRAPHLQQLAKLEQRIRALAA